MSASSDFSVIEWERTTGKCTASFEGESGSANGAAYSPDGNSVLIAFAGGIAREWDLSRKEAGKWTKTFAGHTGPVKTAAYSPDGSRALTTSWDKRVKEWDLATGKSLAMSAGYTDLA